MAARAERPYLVKADNRDKITVIAVVNALGENMPPYIICKGQGLRETLTNRQTLKLKLRSFKSSEHMRKGLGHTAVSAT